MNGSILYLTLCSLLLCQLGESRRRPQFSSSNSQFLQWARSLDSFEGRVAKTPTRREGQSVTCYECNIDDGSDCMFNPTEGRIRTCTGTDQRPLPFCVTAKRTSSNEKKPYYKRSCIYMTEDLPDGCAHDGNYQFCFCITNLCNKCTNFAEPTTLTNECLKQKQ